MPKNFLQSQQAVTVHGRKATMRRVVSRPMLSAAKPTGVAKRFAIPHATPIAKELAILRAPGQRF